MAYILDDSLNQKIINKLIAKHRLTQTPQGDDILLSPSATTNIKIPQEIPDDATVAELNTWADTVEAFRPGFAKQLRKIAATRT